jgi:acyl-CoA reductase-like NAD-dependent aldehyde dehydrogenase
MAYGGAGSDDNGNYIEPTVFEVKDPFLRPCRKNFLFLCFMSMFYEDEKLEEVLELVDETFLYA